MNYTKTGFSYILWGIYTLLICTLLTLGVMGITADIGMMNMPYRILSAGIFFLLLFGISALCYSLFGQFLCKKRFYSPDWTSIELIAVTTVFLFMLAFDIKNIMFSIVSETSILTGDSRYFTTAMLTEENTGIVWMAHGASYVFTVLLRGMCMLFGNIDMAVVLLQVILQLIAVAYAYFAVRNLLGRLAAFVTVIAMAVIPVFTDKLSNQTAEMVLLCSVTVVLFYLSLLIKLINRAKIKKFAWSIAFLCYGILLAGCIYLDAVGLVMLLVSVAAILMLRRTKTDEEVRKPLICNRAIQV